MLDLGEGTKGSVVALDPETGEILALVSTPSYDPSSFAGATGDDAEAWTSLTSDEDQPMLNRGLKQTYAPGSTFKVVTAVAAIEEGIVTDIDAPTDSPDPYTLPGTTTELTNESEGVCENASLRDALKYSCNTVFAKLSAEIGNETMQEYAEKFGYNDAEVDTPVRAAESSYPADNESQNALAGIGQASNSATPLQMAMIVSAIANDGVLMQPNMVDQLVSSNLDVVQQNEPQEMRRVMSTETAQMLQDMMETVVSEGTGTAAQIDGVTVGGKTGTAQRGEENSENPYAWFISYAKTDEGTPVAVAVIVEDSGANRDDISGGGLAAPIAKAVMEAVLDSES